MLKTDLIELANSHYQDRIAAERAAQIRAKRIRQIKQAKREKKIDERIDALIFVAVAILCTTILWIVS